MAFALQMPETLTDDHDPVIGKIGPIDHPAPDEPEADDQPATVPNDATQTETEAPPALPPIDNEPSEQVVSVSDVAPSMDDDRYFEHLDLLARMAECERERREAFGAWQELKEDTKEAKQNYEVMVVRLQGIAAEIADLMADEPAPKKAAAAITTPTGQDPSQAPEQPDDSWRHTSTVELLTGLKGLGVKKLDGISAAFPTVGHLEDARGEASKFNKSFKDVLPDGCGQKIADAIEDRLIDHVARTSTPRASEQVKENQPAEQGPLRPNDVERMVKEVRDQAESEDWDQDTCDYTVGIETASQHSVAGFTAFNEGKPYTDVPNDLRESYRNDWIVGWVSAERLKQLQALKPNAAGDDLSTL